jgi:hypothetical protein
MEWIYLAKHMGHWQALANTINKSAGSIKSYKFIEHLRHDQYRIQFSYYL